MALSFVFAEGPADCISFVSPDPAPATKPGPRRPPAGPSPEELARRVFERVISLAPRPSISVAPARVGLTGLESFFWVGDDLAPVTAEAQAPGLTVTAEARPVRYRWDFGDGAGEETAHPGRPWTPRRPGDVGHLYETKGGYTVTVEAVWAARWRVNDGPWRALGYFETSGSLDYPVREMVAVLVHRR